MAKLFYNSQDTLAELMDYLAANGEQCQEAIDYGRGLGDIKLGDFIVLIADDPEFQADWAAYCYVVLPELLTPDMFAGFATAVDNRAAARALVDDIPKSARSSKALQRHG